jgi:4-carboxymuconolactone decarboxylase
MARVEEKKGLLVRISDWYTKRSYGRAVGTTKAIAHTPWNLIGWGALEYGHERSTKVEERLKALAATKAATVIGCQFCIDIGSALSRKAGITERQLRDFHNYRESDEFSRVEKLVMEYAEEMSKTHVQIPDDLFGSLREHFNDAQLVELTAAIAIENLRARFNDALEIPAAGFSEGAYCPVPERELAAVSTGDGAA